MTPYEVPLSPEPQRLTIQLAGVSYSLVVVWNTVARCWMLDLYTVAGEPLITSLPVVTGLNLLVQYRHLGFEGGMLIAQTDYDPDAVPTFENLGSTGRLWFVTE